MINTVPYIYIYTNVLLIGDWCQNQENRCDSSPCAAGATCEPLMDDFVCHCPPDFTGSQCDVSI